MTDFEKIDTRDMRVAGGFWHGDVFFFTVSRPNLHGIAKYDTRAEPGKQISMFSGQQPHFEDGPRKAAKWNSPSGICRSVDQAFSVADTENHAIRRVENEVVTTIIGNGTPGNQDGDLQNARLLFPQLVSETKQHVVVVERDTRDRVRVFTRSTGRVSTMRLITAIPTDIIQATFVTRIRDTFAVVTSNGVYSATFSENMWLPDGQLGSVGLKPELILGNVGDKFYSISHPSGSDLLYFTWGNTVKTMSTTDGTVRDLYSLSSNAQETNFSPQVLLSVSESKTLFAIDMLNAELYRAAPAQPQRPTPADIDLVSGAMASTSIAPPSTSYPSQDSSYGNSSSTSMGGYQNSYGSGSSQSSNSNPTLPAYSTPPPVSDPSAYPYGSNPSQQQQQPPSQQNSQNSWNNSTQSPSSTTNPFINQQQSYQATPPPSDYYGSGQRGSGQFSQTSSNPAVTGGNPSPVNTQMPNARQNDAPTFVPAPGTYPPSGYPPGSPYGSNPQQQPPAQMPPAQLPPAQQMPQPSSPYDSPQQQRYGYPPAQPMAATAVVAPPSVGVPTANIGMVTAPATLVPAPAPTGLAGYVAAPVNPYASPAVPATGTFVVQQQVTTTPVIATNAYGLPVSSPYGTPQIIQQKPAKTHHHAKKAPSSDTGLWEWEADKTDVWNPYDIRIHNSILNQYRGGQSKATFYIGSTEYEIDFTQTPTRQVQTHNRSKTRRVRGPAECPLPIIN